MDKLKHFGACLSIALIIGLIHPALGALGALSVGIGKEAYDKSRGGPSTGMTLPPTRPALWSEQCC
jgi:hypothetical protein